MARVVVIVAILGVIAAYAVLSGRWVSTESGWYEALPKPAWQPPPWVFGVAWPLNFLALAVSGVAVGWTRPAAESGRFLVVLVASVVLALGWAHAFYVPHEMGRAAVSLAAAAALTWLLAVVAGASLTWAGWVLVPYAVWMSIATSLSVGYWSAARGA